MLHIIHDFFEDFDATIKANDNIMLTDIVIDELAKMVIFDRGRINEALKKNSKTSFSDKTDDKVYVKEIIERVRKEPILRKDLALLIIYNNSEKEVPEKDFTAYGRGNAKNVKKNTIPSDKRLTYIDKALLLVVGKENENLLEKKIIAHRKVKDMNFGIDADNEATQIAFMKKEKIKLGIKVAVITSVILIGGYLGISYLSFKYGEKNEPTKPTNTESKPETQIL